MRSHGLERVERLLGHVRQGHLHEDEELRVAGQGQDARLRPPDDPEGDVLGSHPALRRSVEICLKFEKKFSHPLPPFPPN